MVFSRVQNVSSTIFIYANEDGFDEEFRLLLQIFYFFGFYRSRPSTPRTIYGVMSLVFVTVTYLIGYVKDGLMALSEDNMRNFMTSVPYTVIVSALVVQTITLMAKEKTILTMIKNFHLMHSREDDGFLEGYRKPCVRLVKVYLFFMELAVSMVLFLHFCGYTLYKLVSPTLLDDFVETKLYIPLLIINGLQAYAVVTCMATSDLLHVLCMVRAGANLDLLSSKLRRCTDSDDMEENEKSLVVCVKYHQIILK